MSETPIDHGTSQDRAHIPVWRALLNLIIAVLFAALAPLLVCMDMVPFWMAIGALAFYAPPGILQNLAEAAGITTSAVLFLGGAALLGVSVGFVILGIPMAILGWRLGRITWLSSLIAGILIGFLPYLLLLPFDQSFGPNYPSTSADFLRVAGETLVMGAFGALEGLLFWLVWWFLSRLSLPKKPVPDASRPAPHVE